MVTRNVTHLPNMGKALSLISSISKTNLKTDLTGVQTVGGLRYKILATQG